MNTTPGNSVMNTILGNSAMNTTLGNSVAQQSPLMFPNNASSTPHQASDTFNRPPPTHTQAQLLSG
eukprot:4458883-Prorocentrum_lima.AAC.1